MACPLLFRCSLSPSRPSVRTKLLRLGTRPADRAARPRRTHDELPLRSELLSSEQMKPYGKALAGMHRVGSGHARDQLLNRLAENEDVLLGACRLLIEATEASRRIPPAGEWLLDNFHLIEEQIRTARRHLPKGYSRELPRLVNGASVGFPRVYDIALETVSHGDGRVDPETVTSFVGAYQTVTVLNLGELWAIPIMLRLALIENLRRVATRITASVLDRNRAAVWAEQMTSIALEDPKSLILVMADMARSNQPMVSSFVAELARRLQGQSPALALPLTWIEQRLSESGLTIEQSVRSENQQQAADQLSIGNTIGSLRFLGTADWREFVESMSLVDHALREDPNGAYAKMEFAARDHYRHVVERLAKQSGLSESDVARKAIERAREGAARMGVENRTAHVGFYLVDRGLRELERAVNAHLSLSAMLRRASRRVPLLLYVGLIALATVMAAGSLVAIGLAEGYSAWLVVLIGLLSLLGASQMAVALVNWGVTLLVTPQPLPRMDFSAGIPPQSCTLVVIPTMLTNLQDVDALAEALEVRFLANRDGNLHFGLLTDFQDAHEATLPGDEPLVSLAQTRIEQLNEKYAIAKRGSFFLFHRPRLYNPRERVWMGFERKRGKLAALNSLLRGGAGDQFSRVVGDVAALPHIKYVIALDTDTELPRDCARQLVGAMAHPLNRACYDERARRVCDGYGILQPQVAVNLPGTSVSRYAQCWAGEPGTDPYTRAVSDVYQDVFGEGSFIGKGIYDVDAFERAMGARLPENRILSHDLLEGCYARAGLLSDVQLYEEYPVHYLADVSRRRRWIRGDWQIAAWLLPHVPGPNGRWLRNPLSGLSRWKIFDNLRRSLVSSSLTLLLLLGWTVLSEAWLWTLVVVGLFFILPLASSFREALREMPDMLPRQRLAAAGRAAVRDRYSGCVLSCVPAVRSLLHLGRDWAYGLAKPGQPPKAFGMDSIGQTEW